MAYQHYSDRAAYAATRKPVRTRMTPATALGTMMLMSFMLPLQAASAMTSGYAKSSETAYHDELEQSPAERASLSAPWQDWGF